MKDPKQGKDVIWWILRKIIFSAEWDGTGVEEDTQKWKQPGR